MKEEEAAEEEDMEEKSEHLTRLPKSPCRLPLCSEALGVPKSEQKGLEHKITQLGQTGNLKQMER